MYKLRCFVHIEAKKETLKIVNSAKIRVIYYDSCKDAAGFISRFIRPAISSGVF